MNVTEQSIKNWINVTSYDTGNSNNTSDSTNNEQALDAPSPQVWDLRWFALLSGPLLFGTVILPLVTGPTLRYLCQSYVKLQAQWRVVFLLILITYAGIYFPLAIIVPDSRGSFLMDFLCLLSVTLFVAVSFFRSFLVKMDIGWWTLAMIMVIVIAILFLAQRQSCPGHSSVGSFCSLCRF